MKTLLQIILATLSALLLCHFLPETQFIYIYLLLVILAELQLKDL